MAASHCLPEFLCIGATKAGTSWLYRQLCLHPQVWMPRIKELHYFDYLYVENVHRFAHRALGKAAAAALKEHVRQSPDRIDWGYVQYLADVTQNHPFTDEWYARCFDRPAAANKRRGEITPAYSALPEQGIDHVLRLMPLVRLIYLIRDPVERALSQLRMAVDRQQGQPTEAQLLAMCDDPDIALRGDYAAHVPRWKSKVPEERMLFLPFGRVGSAPLEVLRTVERFIDVEPHDGYAPEDVVYATPKLPISDSVVKRLTEKFAPQREFLQREFGSEFAAQTY